MYVPTYTALLLIQLILGSHPIIVLFMKLIFSEDGKNKIACNKNPFPMPVHRLVSA